MNTQRITASDFTDEFEVIRERVEAAALNAGIVVDGDGIHYPDGCLSLACAVLRLRRIAKSRRNDAMMGLLLADDLNRCRAQSLTGNLLPASLGGWAGDVALKAHKSHQESEAKGLFKKSGYKGLDAQQALEKQKTKQSEIKQCYLAHRNASGRKASLADERKADRDAIAHAVQKMNVTAGEVRTVVEMFRRKLIAKRPSRARR